MAIGIKTIEVILGINKDIDLSPVEMVKNLEVTFFPHRDGINEKIIEFGKKLESAFKNLGVRIIPYNQALESPSFRKIFKRWFLFFKIYSLVIKSLKSSEDIIKFRQSYCKNFFKFVFGKKIKRKTAIMSLGEDEEGFLPMDYTTSFKENPIITIVEKNSKISESSAFKEHMNEALNLFAWNMTNLAICVDDKRWTIYSFNLSNPDFSISENFEKNVLDFLIPKIAAPVVPPSINEFEVIKNNFSPNDEKYAPYINDLVKSGILFEKTNLYPTGKEINSLKFRNLFYRWIGAIHLDDRNGMSYGFLARQMAVKLSLPLLLGDIKDEELRFKLIDNEYAFYKNNFYVKINIKGKNLVVQIPEVWVLTSRSGADKTNLDLQRDIIKIGLKNGKMFLGLTEGNSLSGDYKPSFDTKIILAHAIANAIFGSLLLYFNLEAFFPKILQESGFAIAHWHGYIKPEFIPNGWIVYGEGNPSVSCSSPQAAIYAFKGKQNGIINSIINDTEYMGDIHIEPHHGTNMTSPTLKDTANFLLSNNQISKLGNEYLKLYYK